MIGFIARVVKETVRKLKFTFMGSRAQSEIDELIEIFRRVTPLELSHLAEIQKKLEKIVADPAIMKQKFSMLREAYKNKLSVGGSGDIKARYAMFIREEYRRLKEKRGKSMNPRKQMNREEKHNEIRCGEEGTICEKCIEARIRREIEMKAYLKRMAVEEERNQKKMKTSSWESITALNVQLGCPPIVGRYLMGDGFDLNDLESEEREKFNQWKEYQSMQAKSLDTGIFKRPLEQQGSAQMQPNGTPMLHQGSMQMSYQDVIPMPQQAGISMPREPFPVIQTMQQPILNSQQSSLMDAQQQIFADKVNFPEKMQSSPNWVFKQTAPAIKHQNGDIHANIDARNAILEGSKDAKGQAPENPEISSKGGVGSTEMRVMPEFGALSATSNPFSDLKNPFQTAPKNPFNVSAPKSPFNVSTPLVTKSPFTGTKDPFTGTKDPFTGTKDPFTGTKSSLASTKDPLTNTKDSLTDVSAEQNPFNTPSALKSAKEMAAEGEGLRNKGGILVDNTPEKIQVPAENSKVGEGTAPSEVKAENTFFSGESKPQKTDGDESSIAKSPFSHFVPNKNPFENGVSNVNQEEKEAAAFNPFAPASSENAGPRDANGEPVSADGANKNFENPFLNLQGTGQSQKSVQNPFSSIAPVNPFESNGASSNPFGSSTSTVNPFSASSNPFSASSNPFSATSSAFPFPINSPANPDQPVDFSINSPANPDQPVDFSNPVMAELRQTGALPLSPVQSQKRHADADEEFLKSLNFSKDNIFQQHRNEEKDAENADMTRRRARRRKE